MTDSMLPTSLGEQIKAVAREIALRERVYPGFVLRGRMKAAEADYQLACMRDVLATLQKVAAGRDEP